MRPCVARFAGCSGRGSTGAFERSRRAIYGRYLGMYARVDSVASLMLTTQFGGADMYTVLEAAAGATYEMLTARLWEAFDPERAPFQW